MVKWFSLALTLLIVFNANAGVRDESDRFKLMYDRYGIDQDLNGLKRYSSYFSFDLGASSGILDIVNDISEAEDEGTTSFDKEANIYKVLTKHLNTEKMLFLDLNVGAPLPFIKIGKVSFLPNLFAGVNAGASFTIHNTNDPLTPEAQTYVKLDQKFGLNSKIHWDTSDSINLRLYYMIRQDMEVSVSTEDMAEDGEIASTDDLEKKLIGYYTDFSYDMVNGKSSYLFELKEVLLYKDPKSTTNGNFGQLPMGHFRYKNRIDTEKFRFSPFVGMHIRDGYEFTDGFYAGIDFDFIEDIPLGFTGKVNSGFLTFMPRANFNHFHIAYTLKTAFSNPQDEIWASTIHALSLSAPF